MISADIGMAIMEQVINIIRRTVQVMQFGIKIQKMARPYMQNGQPNLIQLLSIPTMEPSMPVM